MEIQIDLIADIICQFSDFDTLKSLRLTNKFWNTAANRVVRKRCVTVDLWYFWNNNSVLHQFTKMMIACMANRQICANLPTKYRLTQSPLGLGPYDPPPGKTYSSAFRYLLRSPWRVNVVELELCQFSAVDGHLVFFLLSKLPALKKLTLDFNHDYEPEGCKLPAPASTKLVKFPMLECIQFSFCQARGSELHSFDFDLEFLRQCPLLKTLRAFSQCPEWILSFLRRWKEMYLEDPSTLGRYQTLEFGISFVEDSSKRSQIVEALNEFININRPSFLTFAGQFDFLILLPQIQRWTPALETLTVPGLVGYDDSICSPDFLLRALKRFPALTDLTHISLNGESFHTQKPHPTPIARNPPWGHDLSKVTQLTVSYFNGGYEGYWWPTPRDLEDMAVQLPTVSHLSIKAVPIGPYYYLETEEDEILEYGECDFAAFFNAISNFHQLRHLEMEAELQHQKDLISKSLLDGAAKGGHFKDLALLEDLATLRLIFTDCISSVFDRDDCSSEFVPVSKDQVLVGLFHGYEPHVQLDLLIRSDNSHYRTYCLPSERTAMERLEVQLSVEDFRETLKEATAQFFPRGLERAIQMVEDVKREEERRAHEREMKRHRPMG